MSPPAKPKRPSNGRRHFAVERAIRESNLSSTQRLVLYTIAGHAKYSSGKGVAFPAVPTIAKEAGLSPRAVNLALPELVRAGWLAIEPRFSGPGVATSNKYTITPPPEPDAGMANGPALKDVHHPLN